MVYTHEVSIPYGLFLIASGVLSLVLSQSIATLVIQAVTGGFILYLGSLMKESVADNKDAKKFQSPTYSYCVVTALLTVMITLFSGDRFLQSMEDLPAGATALVSLLAAGFYAVKLASDDVGTHARRSKAW